MVVNGHGNDGGEGGDGDKLGDSAALRLHSGSSRNSNTFEHHGYGHYDNYFYFQFTIASQSTAINAPS